MRLSRQQRLILLLSLSISSALPVHAQLMFHNDQSAQLGCEFKRHDQTFYLSSFYFASQENRQNYSSKPMCNTFSKPGWVIFTIDLTNKALKNALLEINVVKLDSANGKPAGTIYHAAPQSYRQGVISHEVHLSQFGNYQIVITDNTRINSPTEYRLPLSVNQESISNLLLLIITLLLLVGSATTALLLKKRKNNHD